MNRVKLSFAGALVALMVTGAAFGQAQGGDQVGGGGGGGGGMVVGGGGQGGPGMGGLMGLMGRGSFDLYIMALGDLNLGPDLTLSVDQKKQIQAVRDEYKKAQADFRRDHQSEIDKARETIRNSFADGDRDAIQDAIKSLRDLMERGPKGDDYIPKVKAVLTPEQADAVEEHQKDMQAQMQQNGPMGGGQPGPPPGGN